MTQDKPTPKKHKDAGREDRLKAALKANMGRRKMQARARNKADLPDPSAEQNMGTEAVRKPIQDRD